MKFIGSLVLFCCILSACSLEDDVVPPTATKADLGETIVFKSNVNLSVIALHLDKRAYRNYSDLDEVGRGSDIGGVLTACGEGVSTCVEFSNLYIMVPMSDESGWRFGGYEFQIFSDDSKQDIYIVVASRQGEEVYSYGYNKRCGIEWINFSTGKEDGKEVFYSLGRSLFAKADCASVALPN